MNNLLNKFQNINQEEKEKSIANKAQSLWFWYVNFIEIKIQKESLEIIPEETARRLWIVCFFSIQKKLRIAIINENNLEVKNYLQKLKAEWFAININLASEESLEIALEAYKGIKKKREANENIEIKKDEKNQKNEENEEIENKKIPEKKDKTWAFEFQELLKDIYIWAIKNKASDIHIEPFSEKTIIRLRVDWWLMNFREITKKEWIAINRLIKYKAKLILNKTNIAQDWEYQIEVNHRKIDLRVSSLPSKHWEDIVIRLLDPINAKIDLSSLWFLNFQRELIEKQSEKKQWLILVTGPTWSWKTSTLYSLLNKINTDDKKIITLEDPVEYELDWLIQSNVNEDLTFADWLRAALRQDPDIIMLWEIRDEESASIALQASITGHFVLSTLHTNSAVESIFRLKNLWLKEYLISSSINLIIWQRLIRKNCEKCTEKKPISKKNLEILKALNPNIWVDFETEELFEYIWKWCEECGQRGFKWREVIWETLEFDEELKKIITNNWSFDKIKSYLKTQKYITMQDVAIAKAVNWTTTIEEALKNF